MIADALLLPSAPSTPWWIATAVAVGLLLVWAYRTAPTRGLGLACVALKAIALAALGFCLLEPLWSGTRAKPGANLVALVADNSQGLRIRDVGQTRTRGESLRELLNGPGPSWQTRLAETFELRRHQFDRRLQEVRDFSGLDFSGPATGLGSALSSLRDRYKDRPVAGILLLTDGNATDLPNGLPDLTGLPPVYPVVLGEATSPPDVAVRRVSVNLSTRDLMDREMPDKLDEILRRRPEAGQMDLLLVAAKRDEIKRRFVVVGSKPNAVEQQIGRAHV